LARHRPGGYTLSGRICRKKYAAPPKGLAAWSDQAGLVGQDDGSGARSALVDFIVFQAWRGRFRVPEITVELLETARQVQRQYAALDLDLADGVNVALAAEYRTCSVLALDRRDFRAIRPLTRHPPFRLLPDDM
jgi:hypothetical protein